MAKLAFIRAKEKGVDLPDDFSAKELFRRVDEGDAFCTAVFKESAAHLGMVLSYTIDILNPEVIVLGGVFMRQADRFMKEIAPFLGAIVFAKVSAAKCFPWCMGVGILATAAIPFVGTATAFFVCIFIVALMTANS